MSDIAKYYDTVAQTYFQQYWKDNLASGNKYPQNYFRLQIILQRLASARIRSVYEVGTGDGTPLALMGRMGFSVAGCDISENMVQATRRRLDELTLDSSRVQWGDIEDSISIANQLAYGPFDALLALGVMPHVTNDSLAIRNMRMFVREGGKIFVEFRNKLFSLFTFNRYTKEFILKDLLSDVSEDVKAEVEKELDRRLDINKPTPRHRTDSPESYDLIRAKFHNPLEVTSLFEQEGFSRVKFHWYHYHPAPPLIEERIKKRFWEEGARLEHSSSWRGYFLCSAFVVEAEAS